VHTGCTAPHLMLKPCKKFPPTTRESSGVTTAWGHPPGSSSVSPAPTTYRRHPSACSAKKVVAYDAEEHYEG